jgi:tetratricopeptide (TPR) repeat protein
MARTWSVVMLACLLAACSALEPWVMQQAPTVQPPASPAEALKRAEDLANGGRWSEAIAVLELASFRFPFSSDVSIGLAGMQHEWAQKKRLLQDQLMVAEAESERGRVGYLDALCLAQPQDIALAAQRDELTVSLNAKIDSLIACSEVHLLSDTELAWRCYRVALELPASVDTERRLEKVSSQLRALEAQAKEQRRNAAAKKRQSRFRAQLAKAEEAIDARDYQNAFERLEKAAELEPDHPEVAAMRAELWSIVTPQVDALVKLGDQLYLEEQLNAAVATWEAALGLKPGDEEIVARIDRAKNVLVKLDELRREQNSEPSSEQPAGADAPP